MNQPQTKEGSSRLLIMDDDELILFIAEETLKKMGHDVVCVADGAAAVGAFGRAQQEGIHFRAIFLDLNIHGGMGGKETMKRLLELDPQAKGFAMSGDPTDPVIQNFATYGFYGAIDKRLLYLKEQMDSLLESLPQTNNSAT